MTITNGNYKKNYTFILNSKDLETLRNIGKKEERSLCWLIRKLIKYGIDNWNDIRSKLSD